MDLYELLGVRARAGLAEVKRAFQKRARLWHPDVNPGDPVAAERYRELLRAFEVLSDPERRAVYDRGGDPFVQSLPRRPEVGFAGFDFTVEARREGGSFREIFDGALHAGPAGGGPAPGEDLEQSTRISFEEALHGARRRVQLVRQDLCPACSGRGDVAFAPIPCPRCAGAGRAQAARGHMVFTRACAACRGTGLLDRHPCDECSSEGRLMQSEWLDLQIPAGVENGSRVRLPGCGNAGRRGGPPGDFVLRVEVEPHAVFRREGADLRCGVPVTMMEAALGAHVEVPTPDGPVTIEVPAGTQNGQQFRLRKRGMPRPGQKARGDLWVEVQVLVPHVRDERSRELLRELQRLNPMDPRHSAGGPEAPPRAGERPRGRRGEE